MRILYQCQDCKRIFKKNQMVDLNDYWELRRFTTYYTLCRRCYREKLLEWKEKLLVKYKVCH